MNDFGARISPIGFRVRRNPDLIGKSLDHFDQFSPIKLRSATSENAGDMTV